MEKIRALYKKVGKKPEVIEIENTLEAKQKIVGGYIQMIPLEGDTAVVICNEEGKLIGLEPNSYLFTYEGIPYDILCGDFIICDAPIGSDEFGGLSDEQVEKYSKIYG